MAGQQGVEWAQVVLAKHGLEADLASLESVQTVLEQWKRIEKLWLPHNHTDSIGEENAQTFQEQKGEINQMSSFLAKQAEKLQSDKKLANVKQRALEKRQQKVEEERRKQEEEQKRREDEEAERIRQKREHDMTLVRAGMRLSSVILAPFVRAAVIRLPDAFIAWHMATKQSKDERQCRKIEELAVKLKELSLTNKDLTGKVGQLQTDLSKAKLENAELDNDLTSFKSVVRKGVEKMSGGINLDLLLMNVSFKKQSTVQGSKDFLRSVQETAARMQDQQKTKNGAIHRLENQLTEAELNVDDLQKALAEEQKNHEQTRHKARDVVRRLEKAEMRNRDLDLPAQVDAESKSGGHLAANDIMAGLCSLRDLIADVQTKRGQRTGVEHSKQVECFQELVDSLHECCATMHTGQEANQWHELIAQKTDHARFDIVETRNQLQQSQHLVRQACVCGPEVSTEQQEQIKIREAARDTARATLSRKCKDSISEIETALKAGLNLKERGPRAGRTVSCEQLLQTVKGRMARVQAALKNAMSTRTPAPGEDGDQRQNVEDVSDSGNAVQVFTAWRARCCAERKELQLATDAALKELRDNFVCLEPSRAAENQDALRFEGIQNADRLRAAGSSLDRELKCLLKDPLQGMPRRLVLQCGQEVLARLRDELRVVETTTVAVRELTDELKMHQAALDDTGITRIAMKKAVQTVQQKSEAVLDATDELEEASLKLTKATRRKVAAQELSRMAEEESEKRKLFKQARASLQEDLGVLVDQELDFPEVMVTINRAVDTLMGGVGVSLNREVMHVLDPTMALAAFDECQVLSTQAASRHVVYKAREGQTWFALKEYTVGNSQEMATSLREAALLWRLKHPAIAELKRVFFQSGSSGQVPKIFLQMPLYEHGQLDQWVLARAPPWILVRQAIVNVLRGLEYLHHMQVVHGDVKPGNILVDVLDRARLADFDVSVDSATRTTAVHARTLAFSAGFTAPEVEQQGACPASDIFSLGKTAASEPVGTACEQPESDQQPEESVQRFVASLTVRDKSSRPSAKAAQELPFCLAVFRCVGRTPKARECCVKASERCTELTVALEDGVECAQGHFTCKECLTSATIAAMGADLKVRREREGRVACPMHPRECSHGALDDEKLVKLLPGDVLTKYLEARVKLLESKKVEELEGEYKNKLDAELKRLSQMDEDQRKVDKARKHIEEDILQLKCPRCSQAYFDFNGCCALTCSRCGCGFCAWCLEDCGRDAHRHVARCAAKPPDAQDPFFADQALVDQAQQVRRKRLLIDYLDSLQASTRQRVVLSMSAVLNDRLPGWSDN